MNPNLLMAKWQIISMPNYDNIYLDTYNGETEHDMCVDFDNYENTGSPDIFDEPDYYNYIDNLNDWD